MSTFPTVHPHHPLPLGRIVMRQRWSDLLFLHWTLPPDQIQRTLPPGLVVDIFQDQAWVGIVPFFMEAVRPAGLFPVPWLSSFLELNVRTYVRDLAGRPGVWFYSLDCNRWPAVEIARRGFHLPYRHAAMKSQRKADGALTYQCQRRGFAPSSNQISANVPKSANSLLANYGYKGQGETFYAKKNTLECFLAERYRLFSWNARRQQLNTGEVWHHPYPLQAAVVSQWSSAPAVWNGDFTLHGPPVTQHFSSGVEVGIFPLKKVS